MFFQVQNLGLVRSVKAAELHGLHTGPAITLIGSMPFEQIEVIEPIHFVQFAVHQEIRGQHGSIFHNPSDSGKYEYCKTGTNGLLSLFFCKEF